MRPSVSRQTTNSEFVLAGPESARLGKVQLCQPLGNLSSALKQPPCACASSLISRNSGHPSAWPGAPIGQPEGEIQVPGREQELARRPPQMDPPRSGALDTPPAHARSLELARLPLGPRNAHLAVGQPVRRTIYLNCPRCICKLLFHSLLFSRRSLARLVCHAADRPADTV